MVLQSDLHVHVLERAGTGTLHALHFSTHLRDVACDSIWCAVPADAPRMVGMMFLLSSKMLQADVCWRKRNPKLFVFKTWDLSLEKDAEGEAEFREKIKLQRNA